MNADGHRKKADEFRLIDTIRKWVDS